MNMRRLAIQILLSGMQCLSQLVPLYKWSWVIGPCIVRINEPCEPEFVKFTYFNSHDRNVGRVLDVHLPDAGPGFDPLHPTKVIVHGYNEVGEDNNVKQVYNAYLEHDNYNVINVEWWVLSSAPCSPAAAVNTPHVGKCISDLLLGLQHKHPGFEPWKVHAIGFSMGAHVAGHASRILSAETGRRLERITGLDPSTPVKTGFGAWWSLDSGDADFVDIVHTNAGIIGVLYNIGDADFYMNGGTFQKGCDGILSNIECSHKRAPAFFAESIRSEHEFWGVRCSNLYEVISGQCYSENPEDRVIMGDNCPTHARGIYYVETSGSPPYALGYR